MMNRAYALALGAVVMTSLVTVGCGQRSTEVPEAVAGHCVYVSRFSDLDECNEFLGEGWTEDAMRDACERNSGALTLDEACPKQEFLGECILDGGTDTVQRTLVLSDDAGLCGTNKRGCELFGGGAWVPAATCGGQAAEDAEQKSLRPPFVQPTLNCVDPLPGEPAGQGPDGQVCTWNAISGATEEGRKFKDYASCEIVLTQRPYYPVPPNGRAGDEDPRMEDPEYVAELEWVKSQIESSACVCCHSTETSPDGRPSNWYTDAPGNFMNTFNDTGLAIGAMWRDSSELGAYPAEENNGFDRTLSGFPTTDPERMIAFFEAELEHRGRTREEFADSRYTVPAFREQMEYEPGACENGEGVTADGEIRWEGGPARYVYVLREGTANPAVPPNLDLPEGTIWRADVPSTEDAIESGSISYGQIPDGMLQGFPDEGAPPALEEGETYYLYVQEDVMLPMTRCLFTYPVE